MKRVAAILIALLIPLSLFAGCAEEPPVKGTVKVSAAKVGEKVSIGKYEQDNNTKNGEENIIWIVLAVKDGKTLLISEKVLAAKQYNEKKVDITWEKCTLRKWLNGEFFDNAFESKEKKAIVETKVLNEDNPDYGTSGGKETQDKIFLLSFDEADKYFKDKDTRKAKGTEYAKKNGLKLATESLYAGNSGWWLRSPGLYPYDAGSVNYDGVVYPEVYVSYKLFGARPAMWVEQ